MGQFAGDKSALGNSSPISPAAHHLKLTTLLVLVPLDDAENVPRHRRP